MPSLLKQVLKQLGTKSLPTKQAGFVLLRELVAVLRGGLDSQAAVVCTRITDVLAATGSATTAPLTAETLAFLGQLFATHSVSVYQSHLPKFVPQIVRLTQDKSQRTSVEAFVVASELAKSLRPSLHLPLGNGLAPFVEQLYKASINVLEGNLADVDVRVKALDTLADLLSFEGDVLESQYPACLGLLTTSVGNETLRLPALRSIARVAASSLCQGDVFGAWLLESVQTVSGVLRRGSRSVRTAAFDSLDAILTRSVHNQSWRLLSQCSTLLPLFSRQTGKRCARLCGVQPDSRAAAVHRGHGPAQPPPRARRSRPHPPRPASVQGDDRV